METKKITTTRKIFIEKCKNCGREIKGFSISNLEYNLKLHKNAHKKVKGGIEDEKI